MLIDNASNRRSPCCPNDQTTGVFPPAAPPNNRAGIAPLRLRADTSSDHQPVEVEVERALAEERSRPSRSAHGATRKRHQKGSDVEDEPPQYNHCLNFFCSRPRKMPSSWPIPAHPFRLKKPSEMHPRSRPNWNWVRSLRRRVIWAFFRPKSGPVPAVVESCGFLARLP